MKPAADIPNQLVQPGEWLQEWVADERTPVLATPVLQNSEKRERIPGGADDTGSAVGTPLIFSSKITLMKNVLHQLMA